MLDRYLSQSLETALTDTPVVLLNGARQSGKSTLVKQLCQQHSRQYVTFDDPSVLSLAKTDPYGFVAGLPERVTLDEVQRVPELFSTIKMFVDDNRQPGKFLLTGSANVLMLPKLSDSLAGRMEVLTLHPLSQGEINQARESFLDVIFSGDFSSFNKLNDEGALNNYGNLIIKGGYPEVLTRDNSRRRSAWFSSYLMTILQRDVKELANIEGLNDLPRLFSLLAARSCGLLNYAELSRTTTFPQTTLKRYLALLQATFLLHLLPAWSNNLGKRLVKSPKVMLNDSGLLAYLLGVDADRLQIDRSLLGPLLENFVVMELYKQAGWCEQRIELFHFRTQTNLEVDVVLENQQGQVVGVEVKSSATVNPQDFRGLKALADMAGNNFCCGIVLYTGVKVIPLAKNLFALPVSVLWR